MTTEYEAITESEWKDLATTEITHLTDEEKDYLPRAWDAWIARVRREAKAEAWQEGVNFALPNAETTWYPQHNPYRATHYPEETP